MSIFSRGAGPKKSSKNHFDVIFFLTSLLPDFCLIQGLSPGSRFFSFFLHVLCLYATLWVMTDLRARDLSQLLFPSSALDVSSGIYVRSWWGPICPSWPKVGIGNPARPAQDPERIPRIVHTIQTHRWTKRRLAAG